MQQCNNEIGRCEMEFEDLTPEQREKARACTTPEDFLALAKAEGYNLSDDELEAINGGVNWSNFDVPLILPQ